ncbi:MAG TPA: hypothetical protein VHX88_20385 [Solirubrobacteraceae bacterium]|nr:hypothetical protein [Solirubrobacteraceae bacterium]
MGAALSVGPLALGLTTAAAAKTAATAKSQTKPTKITCQTHTSIAIAQGATGVTPPAAAGDEFGTMQCGKKLGTGVQADTFTVPTGGDTVAKYRMFFATGVLHGTYDLTPQTTALNFLQTSWTGKLVIIGGTGAYKGATGSGTMTCQTSDSIHTVCTDKLKLKL